VCRPVNPPYTNNYGGVENFNNNKHSTK
jgi:hypothetical protein